MNIPHLQFWQQPTIHVLMIFYSVFHMLQINKGSFYSKHAVIKISNTIMLRKFLLHIPPNILNVPGKKKKRHIQSLWSYSVSSKIMNIPCLQLQQQPTICVLMIFYSVFHTLQINKGCVYSKHAVIKISNTITLRKFLLHTPHNILNMPWKKKRHIQSSWSYSVSFLKGSPVWCQYESLGLGTPSMPFHLSEEPCWLFLFLKDLFMLVVEY